MFKNILLYIFILCSAFSCCAQTDIPKIIHYKAEGVNYYELVNFVPSSQVSLYSESGGGVCLQTSVIDGAGKLKIQADEKLKPSFVLNVKTKQKNTGNGKVTFIGSKEFDIHNVSIKQAKKNILISWDAEVSNQENYMFTILRSTDNVTYVPVAKVPVRSEVLLPYYYADSLHPGENSFYKVKISSNMHEVSYVSEALYAEESNTIKLYPTVANDHINVIFTNERENATYTIINIQGCIVAAGKIYAAITVIPVQNLSSGNYILKVQVPGKMNIQTARFVKE